MCEKERWATPCVSLRSHSHYDSKMNLQFYSIRFGWMRKSLAPNEHACWSEGPISWRSNCVWRHVQFSHLLNEFRISLNICICLWPAAIRAGIIVCKLHKAVDMMFCVIRRGKKKRNTHISGETNASAVSHHELKNTGKRWGCSGREAAPRWYFGDVEWKCLSVQSLHRQEPAEKHRERLEILF